MKEQTEFLMQEKNPKTLSCKIFAKKQTLPYREDTFKLNFTKGDLLMERGLSPRGWKIV